MEDSTIPSVDQNPSMVVTAPPQASEPAPQPFQNQYQTAMRGEIIIKMRQLNSGANWFNWIAGLSMVNTLIAISGSHWNFLAGLGSTQIVTAIATLPKLNLGTAGIAIAIIFNLIISGILALFAYFAKKRQTWAFLVGMILYAVDGLIFLLGMDLLSIGFHIFALFFIFKGFQACREINQIESELVNPAFKI